MATTVHEMVDITIMYRLFHNALPQRGVVTRIEYSEGFARVISLKMGQITKKQTKVIIRMIANSSSGSFFRRANSFSLFLNEAFGISGLHTAFRL